MTNDFIKIPGYEEYLINSIGEIFSTKVNRLLTIHTNTKKYKYVTFSINGKNKNILLHRLVAFVFMDLPSLDSTLEVDHIDRDRSNNSIENLQVLDKDTHFLKSLSDRGFSKRDTRFCKECDRPIDHENKSGLCLEHYSANIPKNISIEEIEYWVTNFSWARAGKELGMSDNGLRKRYSKLTGKDPKSLNKQYTRVA